METGERDLSIIEHICSYCNDILDAVNRFGNSFEAFSNDKDYRNACALCILQIGELCGHLSEEFRSQHTSMPWNEIKAMRNVVAHRYGSISIEATWETIETDIPDLKSFCEKILTNDESGQ